MAAIKCAEAQISAGQRGGVWVGVAGLAYAFEVMSDAAPIPAAPEGVIFSAVREGSALGLLGLVLYLLLLKLIPAFLAAFREQSSAQVAALQALSDSIDRHTDSVISELRAGQHRDK